MNNKKKALGIAEGLKILANNAIVLKAEEGSVLVDVGVYFELNEADAGSLRSMGWFIDEYTGYWCFCV